MLGIFFVASINVTFVKCYLIAHIKLVIHALICPIGHDQEQCFQVYSNLCLHYTFLFYNIFIFSEQDLDCGGEELVVADCRGFVHHHHPRQCHRPSHCRQCCHQRCHCHRHCLCLCHHHRYSHLCCRWYSHCTIFITIVIIIVIVIDFVIIIVIIVTHIMIRSVEHRADESSDSEDEGWYSLSR